MDRNWRPDPSGRIFTVNGYAARDEGVEIRPLCPALQPVVPTLLVWRAVQMASFANSATAASAVSCM